MPNPPILILERTVWGKDFTAGRLYVPGEEAVNALERPWKNNQRNVSCIPLGEYEIGVEVHPHFKGEVLRLADVPGRDGILVHAANQVSELRGCIAPSSFFAVNKKDGAAPIGRQSRAALAKVVGWVKSMGIKTISVRDGSNETK